MSTLTLKPGWTKDRFFARLEERMPEKGQCMIGDCCVYLNEYGKTCAAGAFIPEDLYSPRIENAPIRRVLASRPQLEPFMPMSVPDLNNLQYLHDTYWKDTVGSERVDETSFADFLRIMIAQGELEIVETSDMHESIVAGMEGK